MNSRTRSIQVAAVVGFVILAILGLVQSLRRDTGVPEFVPLPIPKFQLNVLLQEAAYPGMVIHVNQHGSEVLTYTCRPHDAAVAVFTFRNLTTGENTPPQTMNAKDPEGHSYLATYYSKNGVNLLTIRGGFAKKPTSITIPETGGYRTSNPAQNIVITKIAEPRRVLPTPTAAEAAKAEAVAIATVTDNGWGVQFKETRPSKTNEHAYETILATSFSSIDPRSTDTMVDGSNQDTTSTYYGRGIDAIKVRIDRYESSFKEATISFKGAQIIRRNGLNVLWFPHDLHGTSIEGYDSIATNMWPLPREGKVPRHPVSNGGMLVKFIASTDKPRMAGVNLGIVFGGTCVTPEIASLGLDTLRVQIGGNDQVLKAKSKPESEVPIEIPELKVHLKIYKSMKVSSTTLVLPVHYVKSHKTSK